ncbi:MAG: D-aminoacyl-tRNA deacylase [Clostridia bacterium]|nr:D-aminoacyl-tRNA deacylase [Clostridia bacterium]
MRAVVQRVTEASVKVNGEIVGSIGQGLMVLLGVKTGDTEKDALYMADKILKLRIFEDENGKMNRSLKDIGGSVLCVSQFTLLGDCRGQNRPGFTQAEAPERANELYERVCARMREQDVTVETGIFRTDMKVALVNDGPITILVDSEKTF